MVGSGGTASTGGTDDSMLLPLWGQICCKLEVEPVCATQARVSDFINVHVSYSGTNLKSRLLRFCYSHTIFVKNQMSQSSQTW